MSSTSADVIVVGAGATGVTAATLLARQGVRVTLVDRWSTYPPCFKAEKIEPDQIALLRKFNLMEALVPNAAHIRTVQVAQGGRVLRTEQREQFGLFYQDIVQRLRGCLPPTVNFTIDRVQEIETSGDVQRVKLASGDECTARLVVLACGAGGDLLTRLGMRKQMFGEEHSLAFGFTIARPDRQPFPFEAVTCYPDDRQARVAFLTLFLVGEVMRANLFLYWSGHEECARSFMREPHRELLRILPELPRVIGDFDVVSKVEAARVDLYRMEGHLRPGLVLLADAFQSVCPTTGRGLSKVLTDVDVLCHDCVPLWLSTPGMGTEKIAQYYENPRKVGSDRFSLAEAWRAKHITLNNTPFWQARRLRRRWKTQLAGWQDSFSRPRGTPPGTNVRGAGVTV